MGQIKEKMQREEKKSREKWMEEKQKEIRERTIKALEPELQTMTQQQQQREKAVKLEMQQKYEELQNQYEKQYREKLNEQQKQLLNTFEREHNSIRDKTIQQLKEELISKQQEQLIEKKMIEKKFHEELYNVEKERQKEIEMYRDKLRRMELYQDNSNICLKCKSKIKEQEAAEIIERHKNKIVDVPETQTLYLQQIKNELQIFEEKNYAQEIQLNDDYLNEFLDHKADQKNTNNKNNEQSIIDYFS